MSSPKVDEKHASASACGDYEANDTKSKNSSEVVVAGSVDVEEIK